MSTVNLNDSLYQRTLGVAQTRGQTVDEFVASTLEQVIGEEEKPASGIRFGTRNGLPIVVLDESAPRIDPKAVREFLEEEGF